MLLSVETCILRERFCDEAAIKMIKAAGFDAYDYSFYWVKSEKDMLGDDYKERALRLRDMADKLGIVCNQAHAPFDFKTSDSFDLSNCQYNRIVRSIEFASILGAKNIIVHAITVNLPENTDFYEYNREFFRSLIPFCEQFRISVSVENLFNWNEKALPVLSNPEEHQSFVRSIGSEWFNVCVDVGHSAITGYKPEEVLEKMSGDNLKALHIQDNDCIDDQHLLPYTGSFDWNKITGALRKIRYNGDFTFELTGFLKKQEPENLGAALKFAEQTGRLLIKKII